MIKNVLFRYATPLVLCLSLTACFDTQPIEQFEQSIQGHYDADLSSNGLYSIVASIHHGASFWRTSDHERVYNWNHTQGEYSQIDKVSHSGSGNVGITNIQKTLVFWSSQTGKSIDYWEVSSPVTCIDQNHNGSLALIGMETGQIILIDVKQKGFLLKHQMNQSISACDLDEKSPFFAIGTESGAASLFEFTASKETPGEITTTQSEPLTPQNNQKVFKEISTFQFNSPITHIKIFAKQKLALFASQHDRYQVYDLKTQKVLIDQELRNASLTSSHLSEANQLLLGFSDRRIEIKNLETFKTSHTIRVPKRNQWKPQGVYLQALSISKNNVITTSSDGLTSTFSIN